MVKGDYCNVPYRILMSREWWWWGVPCALSARRLAYSEIRNSLQGPSVSLCPQVADLTSELRRLGSRASVVSGSGSACFGLFIDREPAQHAAAELDTAGYWSTACAFVEAWDGHLPFDRSSRSRD